MTLAFAAPPNLSTQDAATVLAEVYGCDGQLTRLSGERDQNYLVRRADQEDLVLKIACAGEAAAHLDLQMRALEHLRRVAPALRVPRAMPTLSGGLTEIIEVHDGKRHQVRLLTFLAGTQLSDLERSSGLHRDLGGFLARLDRALAGFFHPGARSPLAWDPQRAASLAPLSAEIAWRGGRSMVAALLGGAEARLLPMLTGLRAQIIHMDATPENCLASPDDPHRVAGIIDFGDMMHQPLIVEPAVAAAEQLLGSDDPLCVMVDLLLGYDAVTPLERDEVALVYDLVQLRLAMDLTLYSAAFGVRESLGDFYEDCRKALTLLSEIGRDKATARLLESCRFPESGARSSESLLARRRSATAPAYEHFYEEPLHLVDGLGVMLTDSAGRDYIDAYNNVPHVGHAHPLVVNAITRQAKRININTRYLTGSMVDYVERLTASLPDGLDHCILVSSGSEANDIAWRMAWAASGAKGALVMEHAYHGVTDLVARLFPSGLVRDEPPPDFLRTIQAPYPYRSADGDPVEETRRAVQSVERALASLADVGLSAAAMMVDMGLTNNGVLDLPTGYLPAAVTRLRAAGGLFIADEVQAGFARSGASFWRFEQEGLVPDIVTMGKAIGNGFPLAAVVTTEAIAQAFSEKHYFFSSCGGSPLACAAGLAVLDVLAREALQAKALKVGTALKRGLEDLARRHDVLGDVRGQGFLLGVEVVRDRVSKEPAADLARALVEELRRLGVLVGTEGPHGNVIKIRPPMVFGPQHATVLLERFDQALESCRHMARG